MPKPAAKPLDLPPPTARACWAEFLKWVVGIPLVCAVGLGIIGGALWLTGGQEMFWQTVANMGTALFWIGAILLMYPFMLFVWVPDLRAGLRAALEWEAMMPEARSAAIADGAAGVTKPKRRAGRKD